MKRQNKSDKLIKNENVENVHTRMHNSSLNKKILIGVGILAVIIILLGIFAIIFSSNNKSEETYISAEEYNAEKTINGDKAYISSAQIIQTKTGTGPWDENDEPGNDSSETNDIVRSFDQVTWTVDLTLNLKEGISETDLKGGVIEVEASLPEECANVMLWDLDSMNWIEEGKVSSDGRTLTGKYSMPEGDTTIPGKQTLVFILGIDGAGNETEIIPTFKFNLEGNEESEKATVTGDVVIVSAKGKYNIQLIGNSSLSGSKTEVDYGNGNVEGRMYGYGFTMQLYNDNSSKGLKGIEYPEGEISFDIDLKLERSEFESDKLEDITSECTPILWNYNINKNESGNKEGIIPGREMYTVKYGSYNNSMLYNQKLPLGVYDEENPEYTAYNSGNINITQDGGILHITVNNYDFNGEFPHYESSYIGNSNRSKIYEDNIGTFSVGYMQIFVPFNEASTIKDRNYYLTVTANNMNATSKTGQNITVEMNSSDNSNRRQHVIYKVGSYNHAMYLYDAEGNRLLTSYDGAGDAKQTIGSDVVVDARFIYVLIMMKMYIPPIEFIKFDGEGFEPKYFSNGGRYQKQSFAGDAEFRVWYVTKKDGTNWQSQEEMNNGNIEDMDIYDNIEDIPEINYV